VSIDRGECVVMIGFDKEVKASIGELQPPVFGGQYKFSVNKQVHSAEQRSSTLHQKSTTGCAFSRAKIPESWGSLLLWLISVPFGSITKPCCLFKKHVKI